MAGSACDLTNVTGSDSVLTRSEPAATGTGAAGDPLMLPSGETTEYRCAADGSQEVLVPDL